VYRIVTHEGGTIEVESETGKGTRVVVHLPRVEPEYRPASLTAVEDKISPVSNQKIRE